MERVSKMGSIALLLTASVIPATLFFSKVLEYFVKSINPDKIDVTQSLAYLGTLLIVSAVMMIGFIGAAFGLSFWTFIRRERAIGRIALLLNGVNILLLFGTLVFQLLTNNITR